MYAQLFQVSRVDPGAKVSEDNFITGAYTDDITPVINAGRMQGIVNLSDTDLRRVLLYIRAKAAGATTTSVDTAIDAL